MARREFVKEIKRAALRRAAGFCEGIRETGCRCDWPLSLGKFDFDHINPDGLTGEPTLENCQVLCRTCHDLKTKQDREAIDRAKRREDAHFGTGTEPRQKLRSAGFHKAPKRHTATSPVEKLREFEEFRR